ncbi:MaoC family dehydratase [Paraburkholderia saeva]|uniref:MaoC family dehydratase n=1 Tax=Paraburkholderia saeva TaxID=2777537 RepID=UPI001E30F348|nr:MaoC family dehydratase [Paraburkholderia saeva]
MNDQVKNSSLPLLGLGYYWQDLACGQIFRTSRRTLTEADLVNFVSVTGMLEGFFIDITASEGGIGGRPVPGALTYTIIEGFILQSMARGTGIALLSCSQEMLAPVRVNDTIYGVVEITGLRPTSRSNRGIVDSLITVFNHKDEEVLRYTAKRMFAGRPQSLVGL